MVNIRFNILGKKQWGIIAPLAIAVAALLFVSPNLLVIPVGIYLAHRVFAPYLSPRIFSSGLYRLAVSFVLHTLVIQCVIISLWVINHNISLQLTPLITAAFLLVMFGLLRNRRPKDARQGINFWNRYDVTALLLAIGAVLLIVFPLAYRNNFAHSSVVGLVNSNVDDASHLALLNDHIAYDRGILTDTIPHEELRNVTMYPAGWHSFNAVLIRAFTPTISTGSDTLIAYAATKMLWFALLIYIAFRTGLQLLATYLRKRLSFADCLAFALIAGYFLQVYMHTFMEGFYSFVPQIMYGIVVVGLIGQLAVRGDPKDGEPTFAQTLSLLFLVAIGGNLAWFLPTPAFAAFLALLVGVHLWGARWRQTAGNLVRDSVRLLPVYLLTIMAIIIQTYVLSVDTSMESISFLEALLLNGGITIYEDIFYMVLGTGVAAFFVMANRSRLKDNFAYIALVLFVCLLTFASGVYVYQQLKLQTNAYYYYKLIYLMLAVLTPLAVAGYIYIARRLAPSTGRMLLCVLLIFGLLLNFAGLEPTRTKRMDHTYAHYVSGKRKLNVYNEVVYRNLKFVSTEEQYNKRAYYFAPSSATITMLLKSNKPLTPCFDSVRWALDGGLYAADRAAAKDCDGYDVYIIMDDGSEHLDRSKFKKIVGITFDQAKGDVSL